MNLIDKDALKQAFAAMECVDHNRKATTIAFGKGVRWVLNEVIPQEIDKAPVIDAVPIEQAEWVETPYHYGGVAGPGSPSARFHCSRCKHRTGYSNSRRWVYCPYCGAKINRGKNV